MDYFLFKFVSLSSYHCNRKGEIEMTQSFTVKVSHMQGIIFRLAEQRGGRMRLAVIPTIRPDRSQPRAICGSAIPRTHSTPSQMHNTTQKNKMPQVSA